MPHTPPGRSIGVLAAISAAVSVQAAEPTFPTRPIRLIVASSPGGPNDIAARILHNPWGAMLGRPIVIDNRAGAAGVIGTDIVAHATPDGHTLLLGFPGPLVIAPLLSGNAPYDAERDFTPVSLAITAPFVLLVNPNVPAKSMKELVALARSVPGKLSYGSGGVGIGSHMSMELFKLVAGFDMVHVPYKGAGPGMTALLAGEVSTMFAGVPAALGHVKAQKLRAIAVGARRRMPHLPEVPTVEESGYRFDASSWYGLLAPRGTPPAIVQRLHTTLVQTLKLPDVMSRLDEVAFELKATTPRQFQDLLREEKATWSEVIKAARLRER